MDAPFEDLPIVAQKRITALKAALVANRPPDKQGLLERFWKQFPIFVDSAGMDIWVKEQLRKDAGWIENMADVLYEEGLETRREALQAQLCSSIGKSLPPDFEFSQDEKGTAWSRAYDSALSQAKTFNKKLPTWIAKARADWVKKHGSLKGLNRYTLLALTKKYVVDFNIWKDEEVAISEFTHEWRDETASFWIINSGTAKVETQILPETASDPTTDSPVICASFAGQWFPHEEAANLAYQHPRCPHHPARSRVSGSLPLFLGIGFSRYNREELKDC